MSSARELRLLARNERKKEQEMINQFLLDLSQEHYHKHDVKQVLEKHLITMIEKQKNQMKMFANRQQKQKHLYNIMNQLKSHVQILTENVLLHEKEIQDYNQIIIEFEKKQTCLYYIVFLFLCLFFYIFY